MSFDRRKLLLFGTVAAAAASAGYFLRETIVAPGPPEGWMRNTPFEDLSGKPRRLAEWPAKLLALNFWATWCAPCREEIPLLIRSREKFQARGLEVIGIAIDLPGNVAPYAKSMSISYPILIAGRGGVDLLRNLGNPGAALPFTAFVGPQGEVLSRKLGAFKASELDELATRLLARSL